MKIAWLLFCLTLLPCASVGRSSFYKTGKQTANESMQNSLSLRGRVADVRLVEENNHSVRFKLKLALKFINNSNKGVILLRQDYWLGAETLAISPEATEAHKLIYSSSHWPSVYSARKWVELRKQLDKPSPPADLTRIIAPGESFDYETEAMLYIQKRGSSNRINQIWEEIKLISPVWLQVTLETWAVNIEPRVDPQNPQFGKKLQQRWKKFGELQLERLASEPMPLAFPASS
jgi:hypothetical protein